MLNAQRITKQECIGYLVVGALALLLLVWPVYIMARPSPQPSDYRTYIAFADDWLTYGETSSSVPHMLFIALVGGLHRLIPALSLNSAAIIVTMTFTVWAAWIIFRWLLDVLDVRSTGVVILAGLLALSLLVVAPVNLLTLPQRNLYFGYIATNTYHSPTMILLRPISLLLFAGAVKTFSPSVSSQRNIFLLAALTVLSALAKPNYLIALLPAVGLLVLWALRNQQNVNWPLLIVGFGLPAVAVLGWQYYSTYTAQGTGEGIDFGPFFVVYFWSGKLWYLLPIKFYLSILFPLTVWILYRDETRQKLDLKLAWWTFWIGTLYAYMLMEKGDRFWHGNFLWSAQAASFVLFVVTTLFVVRRRAAFFDKANKPIRSFDRYFGLTVLAFCLHLAAGAIWLVTNSTTQWQEWF